MLKFRAALTASVQCGGFDLRRQRLHARAMVKQKAAKQSAKKKAKAKAAAKKKIVIKKPPHITIDAFKYVLCWKVEVTRTEHIKKDDFERDDLYREGRCERETVGYFRSVREARNAARDRLRQEVEDGLMYEESIMVSDKDGVWSCTGSSGDDDDDGLWGDDGEWEVKVTVQEAYAPDNPIDDSWEFDREEKPFDGEYGDDEEEEE
ncbi:unnamed protein product [Vitrella brassicaformis CCMP3155]|uniref:Uncharacterized protein n=1 Tax=Vitrella brassicaformis (strain CCMP3155) TaxID=1169540 RepID=A0A0G4GZE4_VITBC|nr:unnamed protein product [Vitrella brassicaformis CCMP3155]|eukprot:CEM36576.1 unnamed protein product [Vitrella brassicaformis CCMP3155]